MRLVNINFFDKRLSKEKLNDRLNNFLNKKDKISTTLSKLRMNRLKYNEIIDIKIDYSERKEKLLNDDINKIEKLIKGVKS